MADTERAQALGCVQLLHRAGLSTDVGLAMAEMLQVCRTFSSKLQERNAMSCHGIHLHFKSGLLMVSAACDRRHSLCWLCGIFKIPEVLLLLRA